MPTGYTADVGDGKVTDFRTFALQCARNFGATIMQRDEPTDVPPRFREVAPYYAQRLNEAKDEIARLETLTLEDAEREAAAEYAARLATEKEYAAKRIETRSRYETMLEAVNEWEPPTTEHEGLKHFMREQLTSSIDFDCADYHTKHIRYTAGVWLAKAKTKAASDLAHAEKSLAGEIDRCNGANKWIAALYESLPASEFGGISAREPAE